MICPVNAEKDDVILEISKIDSAGANVVDGSTITRIVRITVGIPLFCLNIYLLIGLREKRVVITETLSVFSGILGRLI